MRFPSRIKGGTTTTTAPPEVKKTVKFVKDPAGKPANDPARMSVNLRKGAEAAAVNLTKLGLGGMRAQGRLYVDHSRSMFGDFQSGAVQVMVDGALGYVVVIDPDGEVQVHAFDSKLGKKITVNASNYEGVVDREIWNRAKMGSTRLDYALEDLLEFVKRSDEPVIGIIVCDGNPNPECKRRCTDLFCELASYPVFIKLLAVREVPYFTELDTSTDLPRLLDNVNTQVVPDPTTLTPADWADLITIEQDVWVGRAQSAGVLT